MPDLAVEPARPDDFETVLAIADETAKWLLARGIHQWDSPPTPWICENFRRGIEVGNVYLVWLARSSGPIGCFRFEWQGSPLWPDEKNAGYLYSLCLRPGYIGRGIGAALIDLLKTWLKTRDKEFLRLDCLAANGFLRRWYEDLGFLYCGIASHGSYTLALYEIRC